MPYDYTDTPPPRGFELIPHGTIATVQMRIRPGNVGEDGMFRRSAKGDCEMLDCEFVVVYGPYAHRKFWDNFILEGTTSGHAKMVETNRGVLRTITESSRGIKPDDVSPAARKARTASPKDFDNVIFIAKIGVERGRPKDDGSGENYPDKNVLAGVITPDKKNWHPVEQPGPWNDGGGSGSSAAAPAPSETPPAQGINKPTWAT
jgi:hypothetical protein